MAGTAKRRGMLPIRLPRLDGIKPLRYLPRRVVQAMADHASANLLLGERTVPGRFVVLRLVADEGEREELERQFAESHPIILQEIAREAQARGIKDAWLEYRQVDRDALAQLRREGGQIRCGQRFCGPARGYAAAGASPLQRLR